MADVCRRGLQRAHRPALLAVFLGALAFAASVGALPYLPAPESIVPNPVPGGAGKDGAPFDRFGARMLRDGDTLLVTAPFDGIARTRRAGSVYVFRLNGGSWQFADKLVAPDLPDESRFGMGLALAGDTAFVAAPTRGAGAVYVFRRNGDSWQFASRIDAPEGSSANAYFGYSLAASADELFVGTPNESAAAGTVYRYARQGTSWVAQEPLVANGDDDPQHFGIAILLHGDLAFIGADGGNFSHGAVHVYARASGQWTHQSRLAAADASNGDQFGAALAVQQDMLVIGAPGYFQNAIGGGYVFRRSGTAWLEDASMKPAGATSYDRVGTSVALDGERVVLGGPGRSSGDGALFVYTCTSGACAGGTELPADFNTGVQLGVAVSLVGDELLAGASDGFVFPHIFQGNVVSYRWSGTAWQRGQDIDSGVGYQAGSFGLAIAADDGTMIACARDTPAQVGACFAYERRDSRWIFVEEMRALDVQYGAFFGTSVALSGDVAVVGAPGAGAAYVFVRTNGLWTQRARLAGDEQDGFGATVDVRGDTVAVGAPIYDFPVQPGAVYVYQRVGNAWPLQDLLMVPGAVALGSSLALGDDTLLSGAPEGDGAGSAFLFSRNAGTWSLNHTLTPTPAVARMEFGASVALDGDRALVGATHAASAAGTTGAVFDFMRTASSWAQQGVLVANDLGPGDEFGRDVELRGGRALVVTPYHRWGEGDFIRGAVYAFARESSGAWSEKSQLRQQLDDDGGATSIAIAGDCMLVGAFRASTETGPYSNPSSGGVYSFGCSLFTDGFE